MKAKKIVSFTLAGIFMLSCAMGCSGKPSDSPSSAEPAAKEDSAEKSNAAQETKDTTADTVNLTFWHTYSEGEEAVFLDQVVKGFEEENPGIKIEAVRMPVDGLQQQVIAGASGDAAPDVMRMDLTWAAEFAKLGALQDVSAFDGFSDLKENSLEGPMNTNYYNNGYYGLPLNSTTTVSIWNMDLLNEFGITTPPDTIDGLVDLAKKYNDPANEKWLFTVAGTYTWAMLPWFWTLGGELTDENFSVASGYLNSDQSVAALDTMREWYSDGIISHAIIGEQPDAWGGMTGGKYGMISEGPWFFSSNDSSFKTETTLMPEGEGGSISIVGGENIVMFQNSDKKDAAWKFMQYMLSDESQLAMSEAGVIPTTKTATDKMDTSAAPYLDTYLTQLKTAKVRTPSANWGEIDTILGKAFEQVIRGEAEAKPALDDAAAQIDGLLK
ncbi:extracellular solute-binding protein [Diplocloster modestus]|uniref:Extracellular solute-binding protein n=1 Tax=Diplocloster modestus TaxID=2850322 RepID=A0ABS6KDI8_9FIRM|nr:extracellular solute-binding protein [Diplocloster modestus]MBU9728586.1 extracellular solute-binding protein [Diplocloster modestus]